MQEYKVLLASQSPRRKELLSRLIAHFDIQSPNADEDFVGATPQETVCEVARRKAQAAVHKERYDVVIACDTLVYMDNRYFGKPKDEDEAKRMLGELSGREHTVYSGLVVLAGDKEAVAAVESKVTFKTLTAELINDYVDSEKPLDKAGAYAIQDGRLVACYKGDYTNIMGLPMDKLKQILTDMRVI